MHRSYCSHGIVHQGLLFIEGLVFIGNFFIVLRVIFHRSTGDSDRDAKYSLSKLLQMSTVAEYQNEFEMLIKRVRGMFEPLLKTFYISGLKPALQCALLRSNPTTLGEAFPLAHAVKARFTDLQLWELLRSNPTTLGEAFFRACITKARFEAIVGKELNIKEKVDTIQSWPSEEAPLVVKGPLDANEDTILSLQNEDPNLMIQEKAVEYVRALNAAPLEVVFAGPFDIFLDCGFKLSQLRSNKTGDDNFSDNKAASGSEFELSSRICLSSFVDRYAVLHILLVPKAFCIFLQVYPYDQSLLLVWENYSLSESVTIHPNGVVPCEVLGACDKIYCDVVPLPFQLADAIAIPFSLCINTAPKPFFEASQYAIKSSLPSGVIDKVRAKEPATRYKFNLQVQLYEVGGKDRQVLRKRLQINLDTIGNPQVASSLTWASTHL
ncbi:hypothetical protein Tco_0412112 [Tanacetum coccineum]